jgi:hypothetical protein
LSKISPGTLRRVAIIVAVAWALSYFLRINYVLAFAIVLGLHFVGMAVTFDEFLPGGWDNPNGTRKPPYAYMLILALVIVALVAISMSWDALSVFSARGA